eukprot:jgi/Psemu1/326680/estExt_fgenesh1_pg.C_4420005
MSSSRSSSSSNKNTQLLLTGLLAVATIGLVLYTSGTGTGKTKDRDVDKDKDVDKDIDGTPKRSNVTDEKELHSKIEELDKKGKALFKKKQYLEAASTFTEALDYIEQHNSNNDNAVVSSSPSPAPSSLNKQIVTLINNRSAMYEKGNLPELAIEDCDKILEAYDRTHTKARQRKCRILESKTKDYYGALVECCALQLQYMQQHRDQLRMGLPPSAPPPVQQEKLEELGYALLVDNNNNDDDNDTTTTTTTTNKIAEAMKGDDYVRLLEWTGMVRHWAYELDAAVSCYEKCAQLEPLNAEILVKHAGVLMDANQHAEALALFDKALSVDPNAADALLHRANLRMIRGDMEAAKADLGKCIRLRPDFVMARLRLAAVLTATGDAEGAQEQLDEAEKVDPNSSDVLSYKGELFFTRNDLVQARREFEKAMKLEPKNPTPYVNTALAVLNTPPEPGKQLQMAEEACSLLERAIEVDPQFQAAYVQLGQLKLGMASDLSTAKEVVELYERGLSTCRTKDEMKDLMGMKLLTQAQVDGAAAMKMEAFSHQ